MFAGEARQQLTRCLDALRNKREVLAKREEIAGIVEDVLSSLEGDLSLGDVRLYQELESLAQFIERARSEIADLRPEQISDEHIPVATDELDAIVSATEEATGNILDRVEVIENLTSEMPPEVASQVADAVTRIYEACNFQDITGQRIGKVVRALKEIESKIEALMTAFGGERREGAAKKDDKPKTEPAASGSVDEKDLLNGPQLPGEGISQQDIDALLADLG